MPCAGRAWESMLSHQSQGVGSKTGTRRIDSVLVWYIKIGFATRLHPLRLPLQPAGQAAINDITRYCALPVQDGAIQRCFQLYEVMYRGWSHPVKRWLHVDSEDQDPRSQEPEALLLADPAHWQTGTPGA